MGRHGLCVPFWISNVEREKRGGMENCTEPAKDTFESAILEPERRGWERLSPHETVMSCGNGRNSVKRGNTSDLE